MVCLEIFDRRVIHFEYVGRERGEEIFLAAFLFFFYFLPVRL